MKRAPKVRRVMASHDVVGRRTGKLIHTPQMCLARLVAYIDANGQVAWMGDFKEWV